MLQCMIWTTKSSHEFLESVLRNKSDLWVQVLIGISFTYKQLPSCVSSMTLNGGIDSLHDDYNCISLHTRNEGYREPVLNLYKENLCLGRVVHAGWSEFVRMLWKPFSKDCMDIKQLKNNVVGLLGYQVVRVKGVCSIHMQTNIKTSYEA